MTDAPPQLSPEASARLIDFARACKAGARAVTLYPEDHPAIAAALERLVQASAALPAGLTVTVEPANLTVAGRTLARSDQAVSELGALLHLHLVGAFTLHQPGTTVQWRAFLLLLARARDELRLEGGIARVWTMMAGRHVELREVDYAEVLQERESGHDVTWKAILEHCLQGSAFTLDDEAVKALLAVAGDEAQLGRLVAELEARAGDGSNPIGSRTAALLSMLRAVMNAVQPQPPETRDPIMSNLSAAMGQLSPDTLLGLLSDGVAGDDAAADAIRTIIGRMTERTISSFLSRNIVAEGTATERLARAFHTLVPETDARERAVALAREDVAASPLGSSSRFEGAWQLIARQLLASYTDQAYVSDEYARELSGAHAQALDVERVSDDPPERLSAWLSTVSTTALRSLDLALVLDLLRIEPDLERWTGLMLPVASLIEDLLLVGDFESADRLVGELTAKAGGGDGPAAVAAATLARLVADGRLLRYIVPHLADLDERGLGLAQSICLAFGEPLVQPLAEALSTEERPQTRTRMTALLLAFGATGRRTVERLKTSQNAAVRRTAIHLLREFGGSEALPDLQELLDDTEPQVQREAVRAILNLGTERAYRVLEQALQTGTAQARDAIMQAVGSVRDERATPVYTYILEHVDHRGTLRPIFEQAIEGLGKLRDPEAVGALARVLYVGEWWAPVRSAAIRRAAAAALARIGTPGAAAVLREAIESGPRAVRAAARRHEAMAYREHA